MTNPFDRQLPLWPHLGATTTGRLVYFLACRAFVKIGYTSRDVHARIPELQTGNPDKLELIGTLVIRDADDDRDLHAQLRRFHYRGEWFHKTDELLSIIADLLNGPEIPCVVSVRQAAPYCVSIDCPYCGTSLWFGIEVNYVPTDPEILHGICTCPRKEVDQRVANKMREAFGDCFVGPTEGFHGCNRRFRVAIQVTKAVA
jgi:hypothetical protein